MRPVTVLLTSIGGAFVYDYLAAFRRDEELKIRLVGTDVRPDPPGAKLIEAFYQVPRAADDPAAFVEQVLGICHRERVEAIVPCSDAEALATATAANELTAAGVAVPIRDPETVRRCNDKGRLYSHLQAAGIPIASHVCIETVEEFWRGLGQLGYPARKVAIKPRVGSGSRRVFILDASRKGVEFYDRNRFCGWSDAGSLLELGDPNAVVRRAILMAYVDNPFFDVDVLMQGHRPVMVVPRMRDFRTGLGVVSIGHEVSFREDVMDLACRTAEAVGFDHYGDMDVGTTEEGQLSVIDVSCRFSGSVNATVDAGLSLPLQLVRSLLGLPLKRVELEEGTQCLPFSHMVCMPPAQRGRRMVMPFDGQATDRLAFSRHEEGR